MLSSQAWPPCRHPHRSLRQHRQGRRRRVADIDLESAVSSIMDCGPVSAVDAGDKIVVYGNWLGLMKGDLVSTFRRRDRRRLNGDRDLHRRRRSELDAGWACMLVGQRHHLTTDAVTMRGEPIFKRSWTASSRSRASTTCRQQQLPPHRSIYIVKPKMHGADEPPGLSNCSAGSMSPTRSRWESWTRSVEPPQPRGRRSRPAGRLLHQHRLPRSHRRRDPR